MPLIWLMKEFPYTLLFLFMQGVKGDFFIQKCFFWPKGQYDLNERQYNL